MKNAVRNAVPSAFQASSAWQGYNWGFVVAGVLKRPPEKAAKEPVFSWSA
jgi:hypothetical protein